MITLIAILLILIFGGLALTFVSMFFPIILAVGVLIAIDVIVGKSLFRKKKNKKD